MGFYSERVGRAIEMAALCHEGQYRKDPRRKLPYIVHPLAVGMMLAHYDYPEDVIIAGLLHDVIEDTATTSADICVVFGQAVTELVEQSSEPDKSLSWEERKTSFALQLSEAADDVKAITCCDKMHNMKSLIDALTAGCDIWSVMSRGKQAQVTQYRHTYGIVEGSVRPVMLEDYGRLLSQLEST